MRLIISCDGLTVEYTISHVVSYSEIETVGREGKSKGLELVERGQVLIASEITNPNAYLLVVILLSKEAQLT